MQTNPFKALLNSRKFWLLVFALVQTILFQFFPQFPDTIWQAINTLVAFLIAAIAAEDFASKLNK